MKTPKFIHRRRGFYGTVTIQSMMGMRTVAQWEAWRTVSCSPTLVEAQASIAALRKQQSGLYQDAIFHQKRKIWSL